MCVFLIVYMNVCAYVRKSLTSSTVISPVESRVMSAQLRGESSGESRTGEERLLGESSVDPVRERNTQRRRLKLVSTSGGTDGEEIYRKSLKTIKKNKSSTQKRWLKSVF